MANAPEVVVTSINGHLQRRVVVQLADDLPCLRRCSVRLAFPSQFPSAACLLRTCSRIVVRSWLPLLGCEATCIGIGQLSCGCMWCRRQQWTHERQSICDTGDDGQQRHGGAQGKAWSGWLPRKVELHTPPLTSYEVPLGDSFCGTMRSSVPSAAWCAADHAALPSHCLTPKQSAERCTTIYHDNGYSSQLARARNYVRFLSPRPHSPGSMASTVGVAQAAGLLSQLQDAVNSGNFPAAEEALVQLKVALMSFPSLPPTLAQSSTAAQEMQVARACTPPLAFHRDTPHVVGLPSMRRGHLRSCVHSQHEEGII